MYLRPVTLLLELGVSLGGSVGNVVCGAAG